MTTADLWGMGRQWADAADRRDALGEEIAAQARDHGVDVLEAIQGRMGWGWGRLADELGRTRQWLSAVRAKPDDWSIELAADVGRLIARLEAERKEGDRDATRTA
ncbi:MAG: hypothetical protein ACRC1K_08970 [Planctomycetia bacterium]